MPSHYKNWSQGPEHWVNYKFYSNLSLVSAYDEERFFFFPGVSHMANF